MTHNFYTHGSPSHSLQEMPLQEPVCVAHTMVPEREVGGIFYPKDPESMSSDLRENAQPEIVLK